VTQERDPDREPERGDDALKSPQERVEDLEPGEEESADVKGGATYDWWKKVEP
jgi:hypothetical protein